MHRDLYRLPEGRSANRLISGVRGVCDDVTCLFLHSGVVQVLKVGQVHTNDLSAVLTVHCSLLVSDLLADPNQTDSYRGAQNRLDNRWLKLCHLRLWQVELFQLTKEVQPLLGLFQSMWCLNSGPGDGGTKEIEWLEYIYLKYVNIWSGSKKLIKVVLRQERVLFWF